MAKGKAAKKASKKPKTVKAAKPKAAAEKKSGEPRTLEEIAQVSPRRLTAYLCCTTDMTDEQITTKVIKTFPDSQETFSSGEYIKKVRSALCRKTIVFPFLKDAKRSKTMIAATKTKD